MAVAQKIIYSKKCYLGKKKRATFTASSIRVWTHTAFNIVINYDSVWLWQPVHLNPECVWLWTVGGNQRKPTDTGRPCSPSGFESGNFLLWGNNISHCHRAAPFVSAFYQTRKNMGNTTFNGDLQYSHTLTIVCSDCWRFAASPRVSHFHSVHVTVRWPIYRWQMPWCRPVWVSVWGVSTGVWRWQAKRVGDRLSEMWGVLDLNLWI